MWTWASGLAGVAIPGPGELPADRAGPRGPLGETPGCFCGRPPSLPVAGRPPPSHLLKRLRPPSFRTPVTARLLCGLTFNRKPQVGIERTSQTRCAGEPKGRGTARMPLAARDTGPRLPGSPKCRELRAVLRTPGMASFWRTKLCLRDCYQVRLYLLCLLP